MSTDAPCLIKSKPRLVPNAVFSGYLAHFCFSSCQWMSSFLRDSFSLFPSVLQCILTHVCMPQIQVWRGYDLEPRGWLLRHAHDILEGVCVRALVCLWVCGHVCSLACLLVCLLSLAHSPTHWSHPRTHWLTHLLLLIHPLSPSLPQSLNHSRTHWRKQVSHTHTHTHTHTYAHMRSYIRIHEHTHTHTFMRPHSLFVSRCFSQVCWHSGPYVISSWTKATWARPTWRWGVISGLLFRTCVCGHTHIHVSFWWCLARSFSLALFRSVSRACYVRVRVDLSLLLCVCICMHTHVCICVFECVKVCLYIHVHIYINI